jgi:CRP-like cAMP-binding protein
VIIVCEGHVKVALTSPGGREVVLEVCGPGELLGELSAIDGGTRSASASALEQCTALLVSHRDFLAFVDEHQGVATTLMLLLAERLRGTSLRQLEFGTNDAIGRVCARLVDMAGRYGTHPRNMKGSLCDAGAICAPEGYCAARFRTKLACTVVLRTPATRRLPDASF